MSGLASSMGLVRLSHGSRSSGNHSGTGDRKAKLGEGLKIKRDEGIIQEIGTNLHNFRENVFRSDIPDKFEKDFLTDYFTPTAGNHNKIYKDIVWILYGFGNTITHNLDVDDLFQVGINYEIFVMNFIIRHSQYTTKKYEKYRDALITTFSQMFRRPVSFYEDIDGRIKKTKPKQKGGTPLPSLSSFLNIYNDRRLELINLIDLSTETVKQINIESDVKPVEIINLLENKLNMGSNFKTYQIFDRDTFELIGDSQKEVSLYDLMRSDNVLYIKAIDLLNNLQGITHGTYLDEIINSKNPDHNGHTLLSYAVSVQNIGMVKLLLESGAKPEIQNNRTPKESPIDIAKRMESPIKDKLLFLFKQSDSDPQEPVVVAPDPTVVAPKTPNESLEDEEFNNLLNTNLDDDLDGGKRITRRHRRQTKKRSQKSRRRRSIRKRRTSRK